MCRESLEMLASLAGGLSAIYLPIAGSGGGGRLGISRGYSPQRANAVGTNFRGEGDVPFPLEEWTL